MSLFTALRHRGDHSDRVDAAFAAALLAQERKQEAACSVVETVEEHRRLAEAETVRARRQTAEQARKWPTGRTSAMRQQVDALIERQQRRDRDR